jgi:hypothetical protein
MPSPFPGMDPYLENPAIWPDVHHKLITVAADVLSDQLLPKYLVRVDLRVYLSDELDPGRETLVPDVRIVSRQGVGPGGLPPRGTAGAAVADAVEPVEATIVIEEEITEARLLVKAAASREVVTVIELLSPGNKVPGARGWDNYGAKRSEVLSSPSHLVEIDLLRGGRRYGPRETLPPFDYLINVSRAQRRPKATLWPIRLEQRLPSVPIPVLPDDPDARLDLQSMLAAVYDRGGYAYDIDYTQEPVPPLKPERTAWADWLLREKGLR